MLLFPPSQLSEDAQQSSLTFTGPVTLSDDGVLELYALEEGLMDVRLEDLKTRLHEFSEAQVSLVFYFFLKFFCHFEWDVADGNVGTWTIVIGHYLNTIVWKGQSY